MFGSRNSGKIVITIEKENEQLNSSLKRSGIAKSIEITLSTLLINFASIAVEHGKNPEDILDKNLPTILRKIQSNHS